MVVFYVNFQHIGMGVPIRIGFEKSPLKGSNIFLAKFKGHFMIYEGFQSYLKRGYQINLRMADTVALERRGLFYWRGSSIRDFTVILYSLFADTYMATNLKDRDL